MVLNQQFWYLPVAARICNQEGTMHTGVVYLFTWSVVSVFVYPQGKKCADM